VAVWLNQRRTTQANESGATIDDEGTRFGD
jgi:hypothetical protein